MIYFICIFSFLFTPIIPPRPPKITVTASLIKVMYDIESLLLHIPIIVISKNTTKPVISPVIKPADLVILDLSLHPAAIRLSK